jgi:hypothetical protein
MYTFWFDSDYRREYLDKVEEQFVPTIEEIHKSYEENKELFYCFVP